MAVAGRPGAGWLGAALAGCKPRPPKRPAQVPAEAFWAGDRKAGVFILDQGKPDEGRAMKVFDDRSGALLAEGVFVLRGTARAELPPEDFKGWNGEALVLSDGTLMTPKRRP